MSDEGELPATWSSDDRVPGDVLLAKAPALRVPLHNAFAPHSCQ